MAFTCKYCGKKFCSSHRLPENHDCDSLEEGVEEEREETQKWFEEKEVRGELKPRKVKHQSIFRDAIDALTSSTTLAIIGVTVAAFLLHEASPAFKDFLTLSPALTTGAVEATNMAAAEMGYSSELLTKTLLESPWALATVMLVHGGGFHIFANMITFYFFGTPLERMIGAKRLLKFYVAAGLAASIAVVLFRNLLFQVYGPAVGGAVTLPPIVGASGAVVAVFAAVAVLYPRAEVLLFFVIPMKIKTALYAFGSIETFNLLTKMVGITLPVIGNFASSAHLTGLILGVWYGKKLREKHQPRQGVLDLLGY